MGLFKPGLWHQEPELSPQSAERTGSTGRPARRSGRRSPLRARTAALLHRLRAHPPESSGVAAAESPTDALRPNASDDADLNRVQLTGVLGSEPLLYDVGDCQVAELALACQRRWRTPSGGVQLVTTWFNLSAWEELAEQCRRQFHRGDRVYVEGELHLWIETRPPHSYACHTIVLGRIVLLAAGGVAAETPAGQP